ncbi:MAG: cytochrome P450 [Egibacteraceae bacterium]
MPSSTEFGDQGAGTPYGHHVRNTPLAAGQAVLFSNYVLHRDPRWYPDADRFIPQRWLDGTTDDLPRCAYLPFGAGPRYCPGATLALAELVLITAAIGRGVRLRLPHWRSRSARRPPYTRATSAHDEGATLVIIPELTTTLLRPPVNALYGRPVTIRAGWQIRSLAHAVRNPVTAGLYHISGQAVTDDREPSDWTVVLKVRCRPDDAPAWLRADQPPSGITGNANSSPTARACCPASRET